MIILKKAQRYFVLAFLIPFAFCQNPNSDSGSTSISVEETQSLFGTACATCHMDNGQSRAPSLIHLGGMTPKSILASMETGKMQAQSAMLSREQKIAIAELITERKYVEGPGTLNYCAETDLKLDHVKYQGWGGDLEGTGSIDPEMAGISADNVKDLKLKWAFGFEGGTATRTKPTVINQSIFFGSQYGEVYCLNIKSGCVQWMFEAGATVRGGLAVQEDSPDGIRLFVADFGGDISALNAETGEAIWKTTVKIDPNNAVTGSPVYYDNMVYIPLTSMEVVTAGQANFECCKGSGQVVALNATSGQEVWRHRVIQEAATERGVNEAGAKMYGPSGAPVWCSPTVDRKRGWLYIGTGENNSNPPTNTSDALQALDLKSGELIWTYQATSNDAYISDCPDAVNCPDPPGPDVDFGMAPILTTRTDGKDVLLVGQKSGVVHCLDPDSGEPIWQKRIGRGGALGGIHWGMATDGKTVFAPNSDWYDFGAEEGVEPNPGLFALDVMTGDIKWKSAADPKICLGKQGCHSANSAAPTLVGDIVFAGNLDGHARAHHAETGEVLWDFDSNTSFETVNGVEAKGGAIDGPGPVISDGIVLFNSGYALFGQMPGNVLLAFSIE